MDIFEQLAEIKEKEGERKVRAVRAELKAVREQAVKALLQNTEFSAEKIASQVRVSLSFVNRVKAGLQKK